MGTLDRFSVAASFRASLAAPVLLAAAVKLTADSGYFWFFAPDNVEFVVKVVDACVDPFQAHWFFGAGMTNVEVQMVVTDRHTGESKAYDNALGTPFPPIQDTSTFAATCP